MRRSPSRRLFATALLVASMLTPFAVTPAAAVPAANAPRYDNDDSPQHGLGPDLTARLDKAIEDVRKKADIPGLVVGLLRTLPTGFPGTSYGLGILNSGGWIGHNGSIPGYETVTVYLPSKKATLVLMMNTDITHQGQEPSSLVARAITEIVTPKNVYDRPFPTR